jgi:hypothetical protein
MPMIEYSHKASLDRVAAGAKLIGCPADPSQLHSAKTQRVADDRD